MGPVSGEFAAIDRLAARLPKAPAGEVWIGDDAAVVEPPTGRMLLAADAVVAGVHADLSLTGVDDLGWKAVVANVSDVAAMGGRPVHALVTVAGPAGTDLDALYDGIAQAADAYGCPVVGGDLVGSPVLVVTVAITGSVPGDAVLRSGARPGDGLWVTGPLGGSAAGLRLLRARAAGGLPGGLPPEVAASRMADHARPRADLDGGQAARRAGASAMIDVSDGLAADLGHLADASGVGFRLDDVPVAAGATEEEAVAGGEDYRLIFSAPDQETVLTAFAGLATPSRVGTCVADGAERTLRGQRLDPAGWQHSLD